MNAGTMQGSDWVYLYCNRHGLFRKRTPRVRRTGGSRAVELP